MVILALYTTVPSYAQDDTMEGEQLDPVTITEDEARTLMKQLLDVERFTHSMGISKIAKDERLAAYSDGFMQRNQIEVLTIGYIDSDELWPRVFRKVRLNKIEKAQTDMLLAAHIIFVPVRGADEKITGYMVQLKLEGKTTAVYGLLNVSQEDVDLIAEQTTSQQFGDTNYPDPRAAQETVVNALIGALQRVERDTSGLAASSVDEDVLTIDGLNMNADLVSIVLPSDSISSDQPFVQINYSAVDTLGLSHLKLEILEVDGSDTTAIYSSTNLSFGEHVAFSEPGSDSNGWPRKNSEGDTIQAGSFLVRIAASTDEGFENGFFDLQPFILTQQDGPISFTVTLFEGTEEREEGAILLISTDPTMPDIRARIDSDYSGEFQVKLVIEYLRQCTGTGIGRTPNQSTSFPDAGWHDMNAGTTWDIDFGTDTETNRSKIRGGIAYLIARSSEEDQDTLRFFIKGTNPTVTQINTVLNQAPYNQIWFFKKMAFHESGTPNNLTALARQFNVTNQEHEDLSEDNWDAWSRMSNFGAPCGWGLMQLDNPEPPAQALWDWQANIRAAYDLLVDDKKPTVRNAINRYVSNVTNWELEHPDDPVEGLDNLNEGGITYVHGMSPDFENYGLNQAVEEHFDQNLTGQQKSYIDANWIKYYNGLGEELRYFYYLHVPNDGTRPEWVISDIATYGTSVNHYVREIGEQNTPN